MPVMEGLVGKSTVLDLHNSGYNSVRIKESLVKGGEYTGKKVKCVLADGSKRTFPVARIIVNAPFFV